MFLRRIVMQNRLKEIRESKNISQAKCSEDTGIPIRTLIRYEKGESNGNVTYLRILAEYYGVPLDSIFLEKPSIIE